MRFSTILVALLGACMVNAAGLSKSRLLGRAWDASGCTCKAWRYRDSTSSGRLQTILYGQFWDGAKANDELNPSGWCFENGAMAQEWQDKILDDLNAGSGQYVNVTWAQHWCQAYCQKENCEETGNIPNALCRDMIALAWADSLYNSVTNPFSTCTWPSSNYAPLDCECNFTCVNGYTKCGTECINPSTQICQSSMPVPLVARGFTKCSPGLTACPIPNGGFECIDTSKDLEACGGCPLIDEPEAGVDCSSLPGVNEVACIRGECVVESCAPSFKLINGTACFPTSGSIFTWQ